MSTELGPAATSGKIWMLGPRCEVLLAGAGWDNSTLGAPTAAVHGIRVLVALPMGHRRPWG